MSTRNESLEEKNLQNPTSFPKNASAEIIENLQAISEVFQKIEAETAEIAELIFDYLINATDEQIMTGTVPAHSNARINNYIKILNRLFLFSRKNSKAGGFRVINRKTIESLDKKTFAICMCHDGGGSLDILCYIVNTENQARIPKTSLVKVTVTQVFSTSKDHGKSV